MFQILTQDREEEGLIEDDFWCEQEELSKDARVKVRLAACMVCQSVPEGLTFHQNPNLYHILSFFSCYTMILGSTSCIITQCFEPCSKCRGNTRKLFIPQIEGLHVMVNWVAQTAGDKSVISTPVLKLLWALLQQKGDMNGNSEIRLVQLTVAV